MYSVIHPQARSKNYFTCRDEALEYLIKLRSLDSIQWSLMEKGAVDEIFKEILGSHVKRYPNGYYKSGQLHIFNLKGYAPFGVGKRIFILGDANGDYVPGNFESFQFCSQGRKGFVEDFEKVIQKMEALPDHAPLMDLFTRINRTLGHAYWRIETTGEENEH